MATPGRLLGEAYYPSCMVNLRIRFDENLTVNPQIFPSASVDETLAAPVGAVRSQGGPKLISYSTPTEASQVAGRIPISAHVELPAYRQAGKFRLTFDYNDLPIDPRIVRSLGVTIYLDTVNGTDFADALGRPPQPGVNGAMMRPSSKLSILQPTLENCALQGLADNWHVVHTATGSLVTIEGRDLRGVLLDSPITPEMLADVDLSLPINEVVKLIISKHPHYKQMSIDCPDAADWPNKTIPSPGTANGITSFMHRVKRGKDGKLIRVPNANADANALNFWDLITKYCTLVGAVPYFTAETLWIKPARSLYDQQGVSAYGATLPTPFRDGITRDVGEKQPTRYRRLVFGRNIEEMTVERKMGGRTPSVVEVVSLDTSSKNRGAQKMLIARWPNPEDASYTDPNPPIVKNAKGATVSKVTPSGSDGLKDVTRVSYPGITDQKRLQQIAQDLYEEIGRQELGGNVRTRSLASFGAGNEDPDLLRLRPGDAMQLMIDASQLRTYAPTVSPLNEFERTDAGSLITRLTTQFGGDSNLARAIVATTRNAVTELQNTYRVANVVFDWDVKSGVAIAFDFHNYVVVRDAVTPTAPTSGQVNRVTVPE